MRETKPLWSAATDVACRHRSALIAFGLLVNAIYWGVRVGIEWLIQGLFYRVGVDWSRFWAASRAFVNVSPAAGYNLSAIAVQMRPLAAYYGSTVGVLGEGYRLGVANLQVGPAPYPPIFLAFFWLFTLQPPPVGFLAWTLLNAAIAVYVIFRLTARLPEGRRWQIVLPLLTFFPLLTALHDGQMIIIPLAGLLLGYEALERGRDLQAGAWLGLLFLKPQYAPVLALVLLGKRRWAALAGMAATGLAILLASLAVGGLSGMEGYLRMLLVDYPNYSGGVAIDPTQMISWRALVLNLLPQLNAAAGLVLTGLLTILSLAALPVIWRGGWEPRGPRFAGQMLATFIVTLLVAYHSQLHGAVLLLVPGVILFAQEAMPDAIRRTIPWILFGPPFFEGVSLLLFGNRDLVPMLYLAAMVVALGAITARQQGRIPDQARRRPVDARAAD